MKAGVGAKVQPGPPPESTAVAMPEPVAVGPLKVVTAPTVGVTAFDGADAAPVPTALVAVTVKVYPVPLVRPVTLIDVQGAVQAPVMEPGDDVAV